VSYVKWITRFDMTMPSAYYTIIHYYYYCKNTIPAIIYFCGIVQIAIYIRNNIYYLLFIIYINIMCFPSALVSKPLLPTTNRKRTYLPSAIIHSIYVHKIIHFSFIYTHVRVCIFFFFETRLPSVLGPLPARHSFKLASHRKRTKRTKLPICT